MAGTVEKGITIVFRGDTTKFDDAVKSVNRELKSVKDELYVLNKELKLDPTNFEKLSQKAELLHKKEELLTEELKYYHEAMEKVGKNSADFHQAELKARDLEVQLTKTRKELEEIGSNKISLVLKNVGAKFDELGTKVTNLGKKFSGVSATAGALAGGIVKLTLDVAKSADDFNTLAKQTGLSTETLQSFGLMADLIDVDLNDLAKSAQYLVKNLDQTSALESYEKLGISVKNVNGSYKDAETLLFETITALQQVTDDTERSMIANDLLGKSYTNLGSILNDASFDIYEVNKQVKENGLILNQEQLDALNKVNDNVDLFKQTISGLGTSIASEFAEPLGNVTEKLNELATKAKEFTDRLSTEDKEKILIFIGVVALIAPLLIATGTIITAVGTLITGMTAVVSIATKGWALFNATLSANPIGVVINIIMVLVGVVVLAYEKCDWFRNIVDNLWNALKQTQWIQDIIGFFNTLWGIVQGLISAFSSLVSWIGTAISKVKDFFSSGNLFEKLGNWGKGIFGFDSGGFGNLAYASGGYGALELNTTINVNNNGQNLSRYQAQQFGREIVEYVNDKLGRRI